VIVTFVTEIVLAKVTIAHPAPEYPTGPWQFRIDGHVQVKLKVQNGKILDRKRPGGLPIIWLARPEDNYCSNHPISAEA
jgi:hypothetical protein